MSWLKRNPIAMIIKRGSEAIDSLIEAVETLLGQRGDPLDRVVTFRDLYTAGVTGLKDTSGQVRYWNGPVSVPLVPVAGTGAADLSSYPAVSAPPSLTVDSTLSANILSWDTPDTPRYAYTKVFRADTDNYAAATEIGFGQLSVALPGQLSKQPARGLAYSLAVGQVAGVVVSQGLRLVRHGRIQLNLGQKLLHITHPRREGLGPVSPLRVILQQMAVVLHEGAAAG